MISNTAEQQFQLNNPETLQQMRQQLLSMVQQDQQALYNNLRQFQTYSSQYEQSSTDQYHSTEPSALVPLDCLTQIKFNLKEKSNCITTLAQLSVRLIDCILDEQQNNVSLLERYEQEIEILKEQIDCLTSKNQFIENDAEYFKQHLKDVQSQLEQMVNEQQLQEVQQNIEEFNQKDRQIQMMEEELQRIKNELQFYKFSTRSKKSSLQLKEHLLLSIGSQKTLLPSQAIHQGNLNEIEYQNTIQRLESENDSLKRELQLTKRSKLSNRMSNQIKEEDWQETERLPNEFNEFRQSINKVSSVRFFEKGAIHNFREYLESPRSKFDDENNFNVTPISQQVQVVEAKALNHEWSTKSFQLISDLKPSQLIYLNQEEEDYTHYKKASSYDIGNRIIQQTRETEGSVRQMELKPSCKEEKLTSHVGVNTDFKENETKQEEPQKEAFIQRLIRYPMPFIKKISNFFVKSRVYKNKLKANQSMPLIDL